MGNASKCNESTGARKAKGLERNKVFGRESNGIVGLEKECTKRKKEEEEKVTRGTENAETV